MTNDNTFNRLVNPPHPVFNYSTRFEKKVEKKCKYLPTKHVLIFKIWLNAVSNFSYIASFQTGATTALGVQILYKNWIQNSDCATP